MSCGFGEKRRVGPEPRRNISSEDKSPAERIPLCWIGRIADCGVYSGNRQRFLSAWIVAIQSRRLAV